MSFFMKAKGLIAAILTIFLLPFAKLPATPRIEVGPPTANIEEPYDENYVEDEDFEEDELGATTQGTGEAQHNATQTATEDIKPEAPAPAAEPEDDEYTREAGLVEAEQYAPVAEWDVSDTDEDDVKMYYYEENDEDFLDTIKGAVVNLFAPMTAYAAEINDEQYDKGTVIIEGEGATEEMLYLNWLNTDSFVANYEAWCDEMGYANKYIIRDDVASNGRFYSNGVTAEEARAALDEGATNVDLLKAYIPINIAEFINAHEDFWYNAEYTTFAPKTVVIKGTVDVINFAAFAFCSTIEEVIIEEGVTNILGCAFARTGIEEITLPTTIDELADKAFSNCERLMVVNILDDIDCYGDNVFEYLPADSVINCATEDAYLTVANIHTENEITTMGVGTYRAAMITKNTTAVYMAEDVD